MHEWAETLGEIREIVDALDHRDPMPGMDRIELWLDARDVRAAFDVLIRDLEIDATDAVIELTRDTDSDELETGLGVVHVGWTQPSERWKGYDLLTELSVPVVDPETGEAFRAVDVALLRDVISGCAKPDLTSSKWRKTAVREYVDNVDDWFERDAPRRVIRPGPRP